MADAGIYSLALVAPPDYGRNHARHAGTEPMRALPEGLAEADVVKAAAGSWSLPVDRLRFIPEGRGSYNWLAVTPGGTRYLLRVDDLGCKPWLGPGLQAALDGLGTAFRTALALREDAGLRFVVAPVRAVGGQPLLRLTPRYCLAVFPFIAGRPGRWGEAISAQQADHLICLLAELHQSAPAVAGLALTHDPELPGRPDLEAALAELDRPWMGGPFAVPARRQLAASAADVSERLRAFDDLAAHLAGSGARLVVTHGEPHPGNLIRAAGQTFLIDWDTVALAPPERDLWMLDDGSADSLARYSQITGRAVDRGSLTLYRLAWTLSDLAASVSGFRSGHQLSPDTEHDWHAFKDVLVSGSRPYGR